MILETQRLILREMTETDFDALYAILSDAETMRHYPAPFDAARVHAWIARNQQRYAEHGFGLWTVIWKDTGELIGDCGLTLQNIDGEMLPEVGYHIRRDLWRRGFGSEAARAVRDWAFVHTEYDRLFSYMKHTNTASGAVAMAMGMRHIKDYPDPVNGTSRAFAISRAEWQKQA